MHQLNCSAPLCRSAVLACLLAALPLSLSAQVRRPDPLPESRRAATAGVPKRRTEVFLAAGTQGLNAANATKSPMLIASAGFHRQFSPEWLVLGGGVNYDKKTIKGQFFPYKRRLIGDNNQFTAVGGSATMFAARLTADVMRPFGDSKRLRVGGGLNLGLYSMNTSPAAGAEAGRFVAPTFGLSVRGEADLTRRLGASVSFGLTQFTGFDRDKLRPSDPALADPVLQTPFVQPPPAVSSFRGARFVVGLTYRLGVKNVARGKK